MIIEKKYYSLTTSLLVKVLLNIFVVFYIAKKVSVSDFGVFSIAFIISSLVTLCLDYGFNLKALQLTSKDSSQINQELSSMFLGKIIIMFVLIFCLFGFLVFSQYSYNTKLIILILALSSLPNSFGIFFLNNFKIINRFDKEAFGYLIQGSALVICLIIMEIYNSNNLIHYALILFIARVSFFLFGLFSFLYSQSFTLYIQGLNKAIISLRTASSYATHLILGALIIYIDTFILSFLTNFHDVGIYQSGMRIIMAALLVTVIISDAFIPEISRIFNEKIIVAKRLTQLFDSILVFSFLVVMTLLFYYESIVLILFSEEYLVLGEYIIYIISIIFLRYIGVVPGIILTSGNKQEIRAKAVVYSILCSILLNFALIPILGIEGAFISSLISHILLNTIYIFYAVQMVSFHKTISFVFIFLLLVIFSIIHSFIFSDTKNFLFLSILINIFSLFVYYQYIVKHRGSQINHI